MNEGLDINDIDENKTITRQRESLGNCNFKPSPDFIESNRLKLDLTYMINPINGETFITEPELNSLSPTVTEKFNLLKDNKGDCLDSGVPMLGWRNAPDEITKGELDRIVSATKELSNKIDVYLSLGIGGSYLGIEATFRSLTHTYFNQLSRDQRGGAPEIYFLGQNLDPDFLRDTLDMLKGKRVGVNVISKSGTTAETAIAFRIVRKLLEKWAGDKASEFIFATTDKTRGALRKLADSKGYKTFVVPDNIGGRFSVLSDVGLVGLAMAGIDIYEFVAGFREMKKITDASDFHHNPSMLHAAIRHLAHQKGKKIEVVATNSASIYQLTRWMEQLFPESEGHHGYGLWVSPSMYSEKLHANGQMVQDGQRNMIETFLKLKDSDNTFAIPADLENLDGLNYLSDKGSDLNNINQKVIDGPAYAHFSGGVPNMTIEIPRRNAFNIGQFYYMMELSVALSGYLAGHNPFIQPGVEAYKKAMFAMLGKPGTADQLSEIENSVSKFRHFTI